MKRFAFYMGIAAGLVASCSTQEEDFQTPQQDDVIFYASFEQPANDGSRVYANEDLLLRWNADDRVSIFNKITYNQEYRFTGQTGANAGGFKKVDNDEFVTGNAITHVVSVYPYQEATTITENELIGLTLPAEQTYADNTFGLGANTMVSVSEDNVLQYKNVGGYLMLKLYGEDVSVSSITLKGNNGEKLAGNATVSMPVDGNPSVSMASDASTEITLTCETPVQLWSTAAESTQFWFVVPAVTFSKGFTVTVSGDGGVFEKSTDRSLTIDRNNLSKMSPIEVELTPTQPRNVIYYTSSDGLVITPYNPDAFGASIVSNEYVDGLGVITFDGDVTSIEERAFYECESLTSIKIPDSVSSIGDYAFYRCLNLSEVAIPEGVPSIGNYGFYFCMGLTNITIPNSVTTIGDYAFINCPNLTEIALPASLTSIGGSAFSSCSSITSITIPDSVTSIGVGVFAGCRSLLSFKGKYATSDGLFLIDNGCLIAVAFGAAKSVSIPEGVTSIEYNTFGGYWSLTSVVFPESMLSIGMSAFSGCSGLTDFTLPNGVEIIGQWAFSGCSGLTCITLPNSVTTIGAGAFGRCFGLTTIVVLSETPPLCGSNAFDGTNESPIYVPANSVEAYKAAAYWIDYADRIQAIPEDGTSIPGFENVNM